MTLTPTVMTDVRIYYETADLTGFANKVDISSSVEELDRTTFADQGNKTRVGGLFDTAGNVDTFWQAGDTSMPDDTFWVNLASASTAVTIVPASGTVGSLAYLTQALQSSRKIHGETGKLLEGQVDFKGTWPLVRGQILHPQGTARTATGTGTGIQLGAVLATQKLYATMHLLSISGSPTVTIKIQSSVDNTFASPTDRITFSSDTLLNGQTGSVVGAVTDTWWRATWTIAGGSTPSIMFAVAAGIGQK
jgi:hypothetical protein